MASVLTVELLCMESIKRSIDEGLMQLNLDTFRELSNNENRVKFAYVTLVKQGLMPSIETQNKSMELSNKFRHSGNEHLRANKLFEALQLYNLALLHAPVGSQSMALALGNRSAVLSFMKYYKDSIIDIDTVLSTDIKQTEAMKLKLSKRKKMCVQALSLQQSFNDTNTKRKEYWNETVRVKETNDTIPCTSSSVEVLSSEEFGRHVVAVKDIEVGGVVAVEEPYASTLYKSQYLIRCYHCLALCNNLMPCDHCCYVMFCSRPCKEAAWTEYHEIECPLMATLVQMDFRKQLQALRIVIKARNECVDWKIFIEKINKIDSYTLQTQCRSEHGKYVYNTLYFDSIHTLSSNVDKRTNMDLYQKSLTAALLLYLLKTRTKFLKNGNQYVSNEIIFLMTGSLLLLHLMSSMTNMHCIHALVESESGIYDTTVELGCASYGFLSLINHSCAENVRRMYRGTNMAIVAIRPIKKGTQLFDNYGFNFETIPIEVRRAKLQSIYNFVCACDACSGAWPLIPSLVPAKHLSEEQKMLLTRHCVERLKIESLDYGDIELAINIYPRLCNTIAAMDNVYPCFEAIYYLEFIRKCMHIISETVPRGYNRLYKWY